MQIKKGFTLVEIIFSLFVSSFAIILITASLSLLKNINFKFYELEDDNFIKQMQLIFVLSSEIKIENNMLNFIYHNTPMYYELYNHTLLLREGYQVFMNEIEDIFFKEMDNCIYVFYKREKWKKRIIGCK